MSKILKLLSRILFRIASAGILMVVAVVFCNVVARYVFNAPFYWSEEVVSIAVILIGFFPAAELLETGGHVRFNLILLKLSPEYPVVDALSGILTGLVGMIFSGLIVWQTALNFKMNIVYNMRESSLLGTPLWIPCLFMLLGAAVLFPVFIRLFIVSIRSIGKPKSNES